MIIHKFKLKDILDGDNEKNVFQTYLTIYSQDYTVYTLIASFNTTNQGAFGFNIQHRGTDQGMMIVTQWINNMTYTYKLHFPSSIFEKTLRKMLTGSIKELSHNNLYHNNIDVVALINKIIENGTYVQN